MTTQAPFSLRAARRGDRSLAGTERSPFGDRWGGPLVDALAGVMQ